METIFGGIIEFVFYYVLSYPGAFIRWIFTRGKTFKEIYDDSTYWNGVLGVMFFTAIISVIIVVSNSSKVGTSNEVITSELILLQKKIQSNLDSTDRLYFNAIHDIKDGIDESVIIDRYEFRVNQYFELINEDLIRLADLCRENGNSEEEYDAVLARLNKDSVKYKSLELKRLGVAFD